MLALYAGNKRLKINLGGQRCQIKNDVLVEALEWAGLIKESKKTMADVPDDIKTLVTSLIEQ